MIKIDRDRNSEPNYLKVIKKGLVSRYIQTGNFNNTYKGNIKQLINDLNRLSNNHCAYCDGLQIPSTKHQIDHFKPKSKCKLLAYSWINLFPVCERCNKKKGQKTFTLRPDASGYDFKKHFWCKNSGELLAKTDEAQKIIDLLELNSEEIIDFRLLLITGEIKLDAYRYCRR